MVKKLVVNPIGSSKVKSSEQPLAPGNGQISGNEGNSVSGNDSVGLTSGQPQEKRALSTKLDDNLRELRQIFDLCSDVVLREFKVNVNRPLKAVLVYIDGLIDVSVISNQLLNNVMLETGALPPEVNFDGSNAAQLIFDRLTSVTNIKMTNDLLELVEEVVSGSTVLLLDGSTSALSVNAKGGEIRAIDEPDTEPVVRGPRDGFVEDVRTNITLIRRRIKTSRLKIETLEIGVLSKTKVAVCYIKGIANDKVVGEVKARLQKINIDGIMASGYVEELIADERFSIFPLVQSTERPDRTAASLLEGRIAIIVDNTPMTLLVPCTFVSLLQASEDYYQISLFSSLVRLLRFVGINITLLLPGLTVAGFSFHQELIPTSLLNTVAGARQDLPFPIFFEVLGMELTFELLREAGVRLPKTVGQAVSTVGGLVIGQAAVNAGLISPISVIVVAITAIASFTSPNYMAGISLRILRFVLLLLAAFLGGVGIMLGLMVILAHLSGLRSFGVPYLSPVAPLSVGDLKDTFVRAPWWAMHTRPRFFGDREPVRQDPGQGPAKPGKREE